MKNTNKLPESWCVKNDGSQLFKDTVIKYMNTILGTYFDGFRMESYYYGVGPKNSSINNLDRNPFGTELKIEEFIELSKEINEWIPKFGEKVISYNSMDIPKERYYLGTKDNKHYCVAYTHEDAFLNPSSNYSIDVFVFDKIEEIIKPKKYTLEDYKEALKNIEGPTDELNKWNEIIKSYEIEHNLK